jgi:hypothetical protein
MCVRGGDLLTTSGHIWRPCNISWWILKINLMAASAIKSEHVRFGVCNTVASPGSYAIRNTRHVLLGPPANCYLPLWQHIAATSVVAGQHRRAGDRASSSNSFKSARYVFYWPPPQHNALTLCHQYIFISVAWPVKLDGNEHLLC